MNPTWFYAKQSFMLIVFRRLRNLPMLLLLLALFSLMSLKANWILGAPYLFWHDDFFGVGASALLAVGLLLEEWLYVAILLDTDENNPINRSSSERYSSRFSLISGVKDYLGIEKIGETSVPGKRGNLDPVENGKIAFGPGDMNGLSAQDVARIFATVRKIHSVATYALAFLFGFVAAYVYQWQNENLINLSSTRLLGIERATGNLLGPLLVGLCLAFMVYLMFLLRRAILWFADPLTRLCLAAHVAISHIPGFGRTVGDWLFEEIIRQNSIFKSFHLIAFVKNLIAGVFVLFFSILFWSGIRVGVEPSVALIVCVVFSGILGTYGWMVFQRRRLKFEFVIGSILLLAVFLWLQIENLPRQARLAVAVANRSSTPLTPAQALERTKAAAVLQQVEREIWQDSADRQMAGDPTTVLARTEKSLLLRWKDHANQSLTDASGQAAAPTSKPIMVLVSTTGGGIKAQVWTSMVLGAVENLLAQPNGDGSFIDFPRHVRLIAGASGGMVGAGYWAATLGNGIHWHATRHGTNRPLFHSDFPASKEKTSKLDPLQWLTTEAMISRMGGDCLSPVARQGFFNDLLGMPFGIFNLKLPTRGEALEETLIQFGPAFGNPFQQLRAKENQGLVPTLIYTPTTSDGRRFLICNQPMEYLFYSRFSHNQQSDVAFDNPSPKAQDIDSTAVYSWRINYPESSMTLATAARLSANFPVFVDSPFLPFIKAQNRIRIMDAGYMDNHGVYPLAAWLNSNREWIATHTSGVVLLQVSASRLPRVLNTSPGRGPLPELNSFVSASFNKTLFHADHLLQQAANFLNQTDENFFKVITFAYDGEASLSWYLNNVEKLSLVYPFLSDYQVNQLLTVLQQNSMLDRNPVQPVDLVTINNRDISQSSLTLGASRFRAEDFSKAEMLRKKMARQLRRLENWWHQRRKIKNKATP